MSPTVNRKSASCLNNQYPSQPAIYILGVNELQLIEELLI